MSMMTQSSAVPLTCYKTSRDPFERKGTALSVLMMQAVLLYTTYKNEKKRDIKGAKLNCDILTGREKKVWTRRNWAKPL